MLLTSCAAMFHKKSGFTKFSAKNRSTAQSCIPELINLRQNNSVFLIFSFPCICGENWFCRRSVATFQSDVIQAPLKGPFCYDIQDQGPFFMQQISALFPSTKNISPAATKSISSRRYQLFRIRRSSSLPWRCALFFTPVIISGWAPFFPLGTVPHRGPAGPYSYPL